MNLGLFVVGVGLVPDTTARRQMGSAMVRGGGVRPFRSVRVLEVRTVTSDWRFRSHTISSSLAHRPLSLQEFRLISYDRPMSRNGR